MAAADVDVGFLSAHLGFSKQTIQTVVTEPTAGLVRAVLEAVVAKVREVETLENEKLRLVIELETTRHNSETRCEQYKDTIKETLKEVEDLRAKLQSEEHARQGLENELQNLRSSSSTSIFEVETLRARVASLETSNRETLAIVDTKTQANATLAEDLQKQHERIVKLNQEVTKLNQSVSAAQAKESSAKFREETLKQELALAKRHNDWCDNELKTKSEEALKDRKAKGAKIAELQRLNDDASSRIDSLEKSDQQLRKRLDESQQKADELLRTVQQLQDTEARKQEESRQKIEQHKRIAELTKEQLESARSRLHEVEKASEKQRDDEFNQRHSLERRIEQEREQRVEVEKHAEELQQQVDRLEATFGSRDAMPGSAPQTPRPNGSALGLGASPFGTPASTRGRQSFVDVQDQVYKLKAERIAERRQTKRLRDELEEALSTLEALNPEFEELQAENERLKNELAEMSPHLEEAYDKRDKAEKEARRAKSSESSAKNELHSRELQVRDLSTQLRVLLFNIQAQEKGLKNLTEEEIAQYNRIQRGEVPEDTLDGMSDTQQFISQRFILFKNVADLQAQNQELGRMLRELGAKMDNAEALAAQRQALQDHEEAERLRETVANLQSQVKNITIRMKSYVSERDMFRRMLQSKASIPEMQSALGPGDGHREVLASIEQTSNGDEPDLATALREEQARFDSFREEQTTEMNKLVEQIQRLSSEKTSLQAEISRVSGQLTLASERYNTLDGNFKAIQAEKQALQIRSQELSEQAAKADVRLQHTAEDLIETKSLLDSMRCENANLKAHKEMHQGTQERLNQERETLASEKSRLSDLVSSLQSLMSEQELSNKETQTRLQRQIENLDAELLITKRKLAEEVEESKKLQLRKEFDSQQYQKRIDELTTALGQIREDNVAVKTTRDHLQARVNELEVELRNAKERAERLRPLPTPRAMPNGDGQAADGDIEAEARIQELEDEVADLKSQLDLTTAQLRNAEEQSNHFRDMSRELEEQLANTTESQEQIRQSMDEELTSRDNKINELTQRVGALQEEMSNLTNELNSERDKQADKDRQHEEKERLLQNEIQRLKEDEEAYKEAAKFHQQDLRAQADIAARAQKDYENELVKHAEAAKTLQQLRVEYNELRTQAASLRAEAESAKIILDQGKSFWEERRHQLEDEMKNLNARREDAVKQNRTLFQQLEQLTAQFNSLKENRATTYSGMTNVPAALANPDLEGLKDYSAHLQREKDILEVQYDIKVQEAKMKQHELDKLQSQLDDAQLKLAQERSAHAGSSGSSQAHKELMRKLEELNLIRESNVTLRNENQRNQAQLEQKAHKISQLEQTIEPLRAQISELESDRHFKEAEIKQLQEDRERSQKRIESILSKYGNTGAQEIEDLKLRITELEVERDALKQSEHELQEKAKDFENTLENEKKDLREKLREQFKTNYGKMKGMRDELQVQRNELQTEINTAKEKLSDVEQELESTKTQVSTLEEKTQQLEQEVQRVTDDAAAAAASHQEELAAATAATAVERPPTDSTTVATDPPAGTAQASDAHAEQSMALTDMTRQLDGLQEELRTVYAQKATVEAELHNLQAQLALVTAERDEALARATAAEQTGRANTAMDEGADTSPTAGLADEERQALEDKIAEAEAQAAAAEAKAQELEDKADAIVKQRSDKMKTVLNKKLAEEKEKLEAERTQLHSEFQLKLEQERAIWKAELLSSSSDAAPNGVPATPVKAANALSASNPGTPTTTVATPTIDLSNLTDAQARDFVAGNATVKGIIATNIKKKVELEAKRIKEEAEAAVKIEFEQRLAQSNSLTEKKWALKVNMTEGRAKTLAAKWTVVETAAKETPQRPVVEVWTVAKDAKPAPALAPSSVATANTAAVIASPAVKTGPNGGLRSPSVVTGSTTQQASIPQKPVLATSTPASLPANPFAAATGLPAPPIQPATLPGLPPAPVPTANPFGGAIPVQAGAPASAQTSAPAQAQASQPAVQAPAQAPAATQQQPHQQQQQPRSAIPVPGAQRGGGGGSRGRGGIYQRGQGQGQRGRGNFRGGASAGSGGVPPHMNPAVSEFQPNAAAGNKRPRNDSEAAAGGLKRQRGGSVAGAQTGQ